MSKSESIADLVSGYQAWAPTETIELVATAEAPAATTTFCAFTVSYAFTSTTVRDGC